MRRKWIGMSIATIVALSCSIAMAQRGGAGAGANIGGGTNAGGAGAGANIGAGANAGTNAGGQSNVGPGANLGAGANVNAPETRAGADVGARENRREGRFDTGANLGDRGDRRRFRFDNGRWWYWSPENRWSYYDNGNWTEYQGGQGYTANYAPDMSGATSDCATPAGGYGALPNADQNGYVTGLDPHYRFDNGQWYYQTDNGWLAYTDGQWAEPRGPLPNFIVRGNRGPEAERDAAREADVRGRIDAGRTAPGRPEGTEEGARGRNETAPSPARSETREQPGRNEPARGENAPTSGRNEGGGRTESGR
jgi:hypothetical protein